MNRRSNVAAVPKSARNRRVRETFHVNGSQATNIGWLNVNGQNMWYLKGEMDARRKFMNTREAMLVFGQSNVVDANNGDTTTSTDN